MTMPDEVQNVVEPAESQAAEMTPEEREKERKQKAVERTRRWREKNSDYYSKHRSHSAKSKEAAAVEEFWQGVDRLRQWTESLFGFDIAELQYMGTVMAVLLCECVKFAEEKRSVIASAEDFVWIAQDIEDFAYGWFYLIEGKARSFRRTTQAAPPQRGPRSVSEWSRLLEAGLVGEYLAKVHTKLQSLGYPTGPDPSIEAETNIIHYLIDPANRCSDFASLLVDKAKRCVYKPYEGSKVDSEELSNKEIRELLRELEIVTPAVVDALLGQAPEVSRGTGLSVNGELFEYGAPFLLAAAVHDMSPAFYQKMQGILNKSKALAA
jgi:hypothetical protein